MRKAICVAVNADGVAVNTDGEAVLANGVTEENQNENRTSKDSIRSF